MNKEQLYNDAVLLLKRLISTVSFSKEEDETSTIIEQFFTSKNIPSNRLLNNVWAANKYFDENKPTILLNSHHDTVQPNPQYTIDPFEPIIEDEKLFGLGSNDAGGCLVSLIATFIYFYDKQHLKYNFILAATAEEEISGTNGIEKLFNQESFNSFFKKITVAIVGEPTLMNLAIAEKGLMVLDCVVFGKAGHAARNEGENAIYKAIKDIAWFQNYQFPKISETLGPVKMTVTSINTPNKTHNIIPTVCSFVVDIRVTDEYSHEEILDIIKQHVQSEIKPRSTRLGSSKIEKNHPLVKAGIKLGKETYGSPTTSDAALMNVPGLKIGPGDSARSHTANEFIYLKEIEEGIEMYIKLLQQIV